MTSAEGESPRNALSMGSRLRNTKALGFKLKLDALRGTEPESVPAPRKRGEGVDEAAIANAETKLADQMRRHPEYRGFPERESWKLVMDGNKHLAPPGTTKLTQVKYRFENEHGYLVAMLGALTAMLADVDRPLTCRYYEHLHDLCVDNVYNTRGVLMSKGYRGSTSGGTVRFGVRPGQTWSQEGYDELKAKFAARASDPPRHRRGNPVGKRMDSDPAMMAGPTVENKQVVIAPVDPFTASGYVEDILAAYEHDIASLGVPPANSDQRITAIARCCQDLDQIHVFSDGNIRTVVFVVLTKLLLQNKLSPAVLMEPNLLDCMSVQQITAAIKAGQDYFTRLRGR
ncbi:Fic family protein [Actinocrispum wychmicini]|uniref:Fic/DOC family protein n=1 Tax=Actinocrispum wychmicini TaxID=1213861 RepID=A0A4R2JNG3_9PSEU|nr:Fic family protein [Actinocrispum wychmicini]TCO60497.1 Fic/DOC family protein [Actinocrispum wychmicini]